MALSMSLYLSYTKSFGREWSRAESNQEDISDHLGRRDRAILSFFFDIDIF